MPLLKGAVIGAGPSGLCTARHAVQKGFEVTVYERNEDIGGQWLYTDKTGKDEYGLNIHTAMYKNLRTNIPRSTMAFTDYPFPEELRSYILHTEVFNYYESYANHFVLRKYIKFRHSVIRVAPTEHDKWEIIVRNLVTNTIKTNIFDVVFVASGNFAHPNIPQIDGASLFEGKMVHSHDYRDAERFRNERVLVIGAGPSGSDIADQLYEIVDRLTWSQHKPPNESDEDCELRKGRLPPRTALRDDVTRFTKTGAEFADGAHETFSVVIFATGYRYKFPFLSTECGIYVKNNFTQPLFKQIINIEYPTMAFIGLPFVSEFQVQFALKFVTGEKRLPTKQEMLEDAQTQSLILLNKGQPMHKLHVLHLPDAAWDYLKQLWDTADLEQLPDVSYAIYKDSILTSATQSNEFRNYNYKIIDDKTFIKEIVNETCKESQ